MISCLSGAISASSRQEMPFSSMMVLAKTTLNCACILWAGCCAKAQTVVMPISASCWVSLEPIPQTSLTGKPRINRSLR